MKKFVISLPIVIIIATLVIFLQDKSLSKYKKGINVNISDTTGKLVCDAELDNPGTYVSDDGWAYFKVIVKNYDTSNNVTNVPVEYYLNVQNGDGSSAEYRYSIDSYTSAFASNLTTDYYYLSTGSTQTSEFIVEVKNESASSSDVDFKVDLTCRQTSNTAPFKEYTGSLNAASNIQTVNTTLGTMDYTGTLTGTIYLNGTASESWAGGITVTVKRGSESVCSYTSTLVNDGTYQHYKIENINCNVNKDDELVLSLYNGIGPGNPDTISGTYELVNTKS